jgi:hypothetical protein
MLHFYDDAAGPIGGGVVHTVVPIDDAPEVSGYGLDVAEPFAALSREERFDLVSRKDSWLNAPPQ